MASTSTGGSNSIDSFHSIINRWKYGVFLSFRGEDVRDSFIEYMYRALYQKGILTFKDDNCLKMGEDIKEALFQFIEESRLSVVVISVNYASSSWCMDELVHILQCKKTTGLVVCPVFYHVNPSEVRKRKGKFGEVFAQSVYAHEEKIEKWTEALYEVTNLKGWAYPNRRFENEAELIDSIVLEIFIRLIDTYPIPDQFLIDVRSQMMEVIKLLDLGSNEPRIVGLLGMGAVEKTALAKVVYDFISWQFKGCSFIVNVTENSSQRGILTLQEHLISDILTEKDHEIRDVIHGTNLIKNMVCRKKVLIVLDDVSEPKLVENLIGELHRFGPGSRIIITTRNQHVLTVCRVKAVFQVHPLNKTESVDEETEGFANEPYAANGFGYFLFRISVGGIAGHCLTKMFLYSVKSPVFWKTFWR